MTPPQSHIIWVFCRLEGNGKGGIEARKDGDEESEEDDDDVQMDVTDEEKCK